HVPGGSSGRQAGLGNVLQAQWHEAGDGCVRHDHGLDERGARGDHEPPPGAPPPALFVISAQIAARSIGGGGPLSSPLHACRPPSAASAPVQPLSLAVARMLRKPRLGLITLRSPRSRVPLGLSPATWSLAVSGAIEGSKSPIDGVVWARPNEAWTVLFCSAPSEASSWISTLSSMRRLISQSWPARRAPRSQRRILMLRPKMPRTADA